MKFHIHTAIHEESNNGWVWARIPGLRSRAIVRITNLENNRSVHCEYRKIDDLFLDHYNRFKPDRSRQMVLAEKPIMINLWYRSALGIERIDVDADLYFRPETFKVLGMIRAGSQHPDVITRLATRLGMLGVWLGMVSIVISLISLNAVPPCLRLLGITFMAATGVLGVFLSRGIKD